MDNLLDIWNILLDTNHELVEFEGPEDGDFGFVYEIYNTTNSKMYIGKKQFWSHRKMKIGKREKKRRVADGDLSRFKRVKRETKWREYTGSNDQLNENIRSGHKITRTILKIAKSKKELTYLELKYLFCREVIESDRYYNGNISGKFYSKDLL